MSTIARAKPGHTYGVGADLTTIPCASCGLLFAAPERWVYERRQDHKDFWCPNGHSLSFKGDTEVERLERQLRDVQDVAAARLAERDQAHASLRATRGVVTRYRNRLATGECPWCGRHLAHLERHIARVHPDHTDPEGDA